MRVRTGGVRQYTFRGPRTRRIPWLWKQYNEQKLLLHVSRVHEGMLRNTLELWRELYEQQQSNARVARVYTHTNLCVSNSSKVLGPIERYYAPKHRRCGNRYKTVVEYYTLLFD